MAAKTRAGGGVARYVTDKNAAEMETPRSIEERRKAELLESLKYNPPKKKSAPANKPAPQPQNTGAKRTQSNGAEDEQQSRPPFGTNGSSIDVSSSSRQTGLVQAPNWHNKSQGQLDGGAYGPEDEAAGFETELDAIGDEEEYGYDSGLPTDPFGASRRMHNQEHQEHEPGNRTNGQFPDMPGDSYPETTDGPDADDSQQRHEYNQSHSENPQTTNLPTRGTGTRVPLSQNMQAHPTPQHQPTQQAQGDRQPALKEPPPTNVDNLMTAINNDFLWEKRTGSQNLTQPRSASDQEANAFISTTGPTNDAQDGSVRQLNSGLPPVAHQLAMPANRPGTPREHGKQPSSKPKVRHENAVGIPTELARNVRAAQQPHLKNDAKQQVDIGPPAQPSRQQHRQQTRKQQPQPQQSQQPQKQLQSQLQQQSPRRPQMHEPQRTKHRPRHHQPRVDAEIQLDYEREDLVNMGYDELKSQPLDVDPNAAPFNKFAKGTIVGDLQKKLAAVRHMPYEDQEDFFTSLDIDTWEDAGDWFLEQFGVLTKQLKESRREKRNAAQAFEEEISARHFAVSKKFKLTDNALSEMKESGGKVLRGTPTTKSKKST